MTPKALQAPQARRKRKQPQPVNPDGPFSIAHAARILRGLDLMANRLDDRQKRALHATCQLLRDANKRDQINLTTSGRKTVTKQQLMAWAETYAKPEMRATLGLGPRKNVVIGHAVLPAMTAQGRNYSTPGDYAALRDEFDKLHIQYSQALDENANLKREKGELQPDAERWRQRRAKAVKSGQQGRGVKKTRS